MGISVEKPIYQNLFEISMKEIFGKSDTIDLQQSKRAERSNFLSRYVLHRQQARRREVFDGLWNYYVYKLSQVSSNRKQVTGFQLEIQFAQQTSAQVKEHVFELISLAQLCMSIDEVGHFIKRLKVFHDLFANMRSLHFNYYRAPVAHVGPVYLGERSGGKRLPIKVCKRFGDPHTQFARHDPLDFLEGKWLD